MSGKVSIIIPTHYRDESLRRALDSARQQNYAPIETLVIDDSGEEYAIDTVDKYPDVTYIPHSENHGAHAARNTGVKNATGKYIQFLDDDDQLYPEKITKQTTVFENQPEVGVVYCGMRREDGIDLRPNNEIRGDVLEEALRFLSDPVKTSTLLIRTEVIQNVMPLFTNSPGSDDLRLCIELARQTQFEFVDEILVVNGESGRNRGSSWGAVVGRKMILQQYQNLYDQFDPKVRREALAKTYKLAGRQQMGDSIWSAKAIKAFGLALYYKKGWPPSYLGEFFSSLGGQPTRRLATHIWNMFYDK